MAAPKTYRLLDNSRFYILAFSLLLSGAIFAWVRLHAGDDQLFLIRLQQTFGFVSLFYWYCALVISPIGYVIGKHRMKKIEFSRRAIGVSAFYFALLHGCVALWGQLGGIGQLSYLPALFIWSLIGGAAGFGILLIMAATSFDKVVGFMTFRWWKWLHRLGYVGGIAVMLHIWTIGTHLAYGGVQIAVFIALMVLAGLETYRTAVLINKNYLHLGKTEAAVGGVAMWAIIVAVVFAVPAYVQNYHSRHTVHEGSTHTHNGGQP